MEGRIEHGWERRRLCLRWDSLKRGLHLHQQMQGQSHFYPPWNHPPGTVHTSAFWKVAAPHPSKSAKVHTLDQLRLHHCVLNDINSDAAFLILTLYIHFEMLLLHPPHVHTKCFAPIDFLALRNLFYFLIYLHYSIVCILSNFLLIGKGFVFY